MASIPNLTSHAHLLVHVEDRGTEPHTKASTNRIVPAVGEERVDTNFNRESQKWFDIT